MNRSRGYSLIEIIVVITIGAVLSSIGLFGINNLNRRQVVVQNAKTIVSEIRKTKSLADAQQKPTGCDTLNGYSLTIVDENTIKISAVCENGLYLYQERTTGAVLGNLNSVYFPVLQQPAEFDSGDETGRITVAQNEQTITINISYTGAIDYE